jgi:hypothetical protein
LIKDITANAGAVAPAGSGQGAELRIHFLLNRVPRRSMPDDSPEKASEGYVSFASIKVAHELSPEEAGRITEIIRLCSAVIVETQEGDGKTNVHSMIIARAEDTAQ